MTGKHLRIGITGGIGAGKSTVAQIFEVLGVPRYDADSRAKELMNSEPELIKSIKQLFGSEAYENGQLNRSHISKQAFSNPEKLNLLNKLVHPKVGEDYQKWIGTLPVDSYSLKEAALLFESGSYKQLDKVVYVSAPEELRINRVLKRDPHRTKEDVQKIIEKQWSENKKVRIADYVIANDGSSRLIPQVLQLNELFLAQVGG